MLKVSFIIKQKKSFLLCVRLDHDVAVDEDGADDGKGEEGMCENMDCNPSDGMEGREHKEGLVGREPEDGPALGHNDEGAFVQVEGVDVADGGAGELQGELAKSPRDVIAWRKKGSFKSGTFKEESTLSFFLSFF